MVRVNSEKFLVNYSQLGIVHFNWPPVINYFTIYLWPIAFSITK